MFAASKTDGATTAANYIEDVFSTYLYTGNGSTQTITNGIDLSTYGGLSWIKCRNDATHHYLYDTNRGTTKSLQSSSTAAQETYTDSLTAFNTNGFSIGANARLNTNANTYASWTFRKQAKFFDVVTYTGTGTARTVAHNLGSAPGMMIVKRSGAVGEWNVYHRSLATNQYLTLESTAAVSTSASYWNNTAPTATEFSVSSVNNTNGNTYVAYLFAHDAGGFGASGSDNVISCGSVVGVSGDTTASVGFEPQWLLIKNRSSASDWWIVDTMRGLTAPSTNAKLLVSNRVDAETALGLYLTSTGFTSPNLTSGETYIYIAIRRSPMKTPTSGTSVFAMDTQSSFATNELVDSNFPPDQFFAKDRVSTGTWYSQSRLTGGYLSTNSTAAETSPGFWLFNGAGGKLYANTGYTNTPIYYLLGRAPGFFDVVVVTTNGQASAITSTHNLGVVPEMMIAKKRGPANGTGDWMVYHKDLNGGVTPQNYIIRLNSTSGEGAASGVWNNTAPTSTQFTIGTDGDVNSGTSGDTTVFYLFATVAGVSKVGSYTGTGTTKQIDCGFAAGARFVLIKRRDATGGDWYVWDTARGIVSGNDPYLLLNSSAGETTGTDYIDPLNAGFEISSTAPAAINANGGTYIFWAVA